MINIIVMTPMMMICGMDYDDTMSSISKPGCPGEPMMPWYLIIGGVLTIGLVLVRCHIIIIKIIIIKIIITITIIIIIMMMMIIIISIVFIKKVFGIQMDCTRLLLTGICWRCGGGGPGREGRSVGCW